MKNQNSKKDILQNLINITIEEVEKYYNDKVVLESNESCMYIPDELQETIGFREYFAKIQKQDEPKFAKLNNKLNFNK